jgi:hypothetical protein
MSIVYPITPPSTPKPSAIRWTELNVIGQSVAQYSLKRQVFDWGGCAWQSEVDFDPLYRDEAAPWIAFLSSLRGVYGSFYWGDTLFSTPLGTAAGAPRVNGAGQIGFSVATENWTAGATLKAGDMFSIDNKLYRNLTDVTANGSGQATLDIWPSLRGHADHASITTTNPTGIFRLAENAIITQNAGRNAVWEISFTAIEVRS